MGTRHSVTHEYVQKILADGQWHDFEKVLFEATKSVPPQIAMRVAERSREAQYRKEHNLSKEDPIPPRTRRVTVDHLIRVGSKEVARQVLTNALYEHAAIEDTGQRLVRIRPKDPIPLPPGMVRPIKERSEWVSLSAEERQRRRTAAGVRSAQTRMRKLGIDPATHKTRRQREQEVRDWWNSLTPEERKAEHQRRYHKGIETRKRRESGERL